MLKSRNLQAILLATVAVYQSCFGQDPIVKRPTRVIYDGVTSVDDITDSSDQRGNGYYQVLYIDDQTEPNVLVVGERNYVRTYDITDVSSIQSSDNFQLVETEGTGAIPCLSAVRAADNPNAQCQNYINVIKCNSDRNEWYYCGTSGINPQCWKCENQACTTAEENNPFSAAGVVTRDRKIDQPFLFSSGEVYGAAVQNPGTNNGNRFIRSDLDLADGTFDQRDDSSVTTDQDDPDWINEPEYIGEPIKYTNEDGETHIYFFFRENSQEYQNADKVMYSRVARVCENDQGGSLGSLLDSKFTTFLKARLNCSTPGFFPFHYNYLQDVYQSPSNSDIIYATFTDTPAMGHANSALCVYRMDEIAAVFKNSKFKGDGLNRLWLPIDDSVVPSPRPGTCSATQPQASFSFIKNYPLMDQAVPNKQAYPGVVGAFDRDSDPAVMILDGLYVTEMVVDEGVCGKDIFFLGTVDGKVYKAYVEGSGTSAETRLVEKIDLAESGSSDNEEVLSMIIHSGTLFVGTVSSLHEIPVEHCTDYNNQECIIHQDPYCTLSGSGCANDCNGDKCLAGDPYSCNPTNWPEPEFFNPTACTYDPHIMYTPDGISAGASSNVQINTWVQGEPGTIWGETTFSCSCGCPPVEKQETTTLSTSTSMETLLGSYMFDLSSCTTYVDVTFNFQAYGNTITKMVTVQVNAGEITTNATLIKSVNKLDEEISNYYYQACWWDRNMDTIRNAEDVYCYNCGNSP